MQLFAKLHTIMDNSVYNWVGFIICVLEKNVIATRNLNALMFSQWDRDKRHARGTRGSEGNPEDFHLAKVISFLCKDAMEFAGFYYSTSIAPSTLDIKKITLCLSRLLSALQEWLQVSNCAARGYNDFFFLFSPPVSLALLMFSNVMWLQLTSS